MQEKSNCDLTASNSEIIYLICNDFIKPLSELFSFISLTIIQFHVILFSNVWRMCPLYCGPEPGHWCSDITWSERREAAHHTWPKLISPALTHDTHYGDIRQLLHFSWLKTNAKICGGQPRQKNMYHIKLLGSNSALLQLDFFSLTMTGKNQTR